MARDIILECRNIEKKYGDKKVLQYVSISAHYGEFVCLLGESGCGKTTLFNIISGILTPTSGKVLLKEKDITGKAGHISYMFQKDFLLPQKTLMSNLIIPLLIKGVPKEEAITKASENLELFGLSGYENSYPSQLSGGMKQRAALLRTFLYSHGISLLDEPFSALDAMTKSRLHNWYLDVTKKLKMTTILITHDVDEAIKLADRIYVMSHHGQIVGEFSKDMHPWESNLKAEKALQLKDKIIKLISQS